MKRICTLIALLTIPLGGCIYVAPVAPLPKPVPVPTPKPHPRPQIEVLAFTAEWCGPCKRNMPTLLSLKATGVKVTIIDIDRQPELARQYGITSVPTYFVLVDGKQDLRTQDVWVVIARVKR